MNSSGKVLTVFLVIIAILLISMTAVSLFFWQKEIEDRKNVEVSLDSTKDKVKNLVEEVQAVNKKNSILEEKNKEADERINNLLDELELQEGLRDEIKGESSKLKEELELVKKERDQLKKDQDTLSKSLNEKVSQLEKSIDEKAKKEQELENKNKELSAEIEKLTNSLNNSSSMLKDPLGTNNEKVIQSSAKTSEMTRTASKITDGSGTIKSMGVELDEIIVVPETEIADLEVLPDSTKKKDGRVLSVDKETEFLIINLGDKDGIAVGKIMSVYRGKEYLGDVRVTRVQPEMSAADLIPPFSVRLVRRNDQVVNKQ